MAFKQWRSLFLGLKGLKEKASRTEGEGFENMGETGTNLTGRASFGKRYEEWKRANVLEVALENMPKQIDKDKVLDALLKLHSDYVENLSEET